MQDTIRRDLEGAKLFLLQWMRSLMECKMDYTQIPVFQTLMGRTTILIDLWDVLLKTLQFEQKRDPSIRECAAVYEILSDVGAKAEQLKIPCSSFY